MLYLYWSIILFSYFHFYFATYFGWIWYFYSDTFFMCCTFTRYNLWQPENCEVTPDLRTETDALPAKKPAIYQRGRGRERRWFCMSHAQHRHTNTRSLPPSCACSTWSFIHTQSLFSFILLSMHAPDFFPWETVCADAYIVALTSRHGFKIGYPLCW